MRHLQPLQRLVAFILAAAFLIGCSALEVPVPPPTAIITPTNSVAPPSPITGLATVDSVEIRILESFPAQAQAVARGSLPDSCTQIGQITQAREGPTFDVTITTTRPADAICAQVLALFEEVVPLDAAGLGSGVYTVLVNGVSASFELPVGQMVSDLSRGYSMVLPREWEACATTEYSRLFCAPQTGPTGPGFPAFYVSVIPAGFTNDDASVYNFLPEEIVRRFLALPVGETLAAGEPNSEYSTFTRLPDATIAGEAWVVIENGRVWEGGPDTKDRRLMMAHGDLTYLVGAYYKTRSELDGLEAILATLVFTL